jgi:hypothetical protein
MGGFRGNIDRVGTRRYAYQRIRPDGEAIDDTEWSLAHIESAVQPVLAEIVGRWPLTLEDKATLAEFIAVQLVRGPRWWADRRRLVHEVEADALANGLTGPDGIPRRVSRDEIEGSIERLLDNTMRDTDMFRLSRRLSTVTCSMSWTLLTFDRDVLALSDHPVVVWPADAPRWRRRGAFGMRSAPIDAAEIRMPVSPRAALLMTWRDSGDDPLPRRGTLRDARSINEPMIGQADTQWLRVPDSSPLRASGAVNAIASTIWRRYDTSAVRRSSVRRRVHSLLTATPLNDDELTVTGEFAVVGPTPSADRFASAPVNGQPDSDGA